MKLGFGLIAAAASAVFLAAPSPAQADPFDFFKSIVKRPYSDGFLPDGAYIMDEEDYYRYLKRKRTRRRAIQQGYYEPEYEPDRDPVYTEPSRPKKKAAKPAIKSVTKSVPVKKKPAAVATVKAEPKTVAAPKPKTLAIAKPVTPVPETTGSTTPSSGGMSCAKATQIVSGYGFDSVAPQACAGKVYAFNAQRGGKSFIVRVDSASGELTEVKKVP
jgi:hypothetical protein